MSVFRSFRQWLSLKQYQLEVTFSVYMFTPWEKFIFSMSLRSGGVFVYACANTFALADSVVFLLFSLTFIAACLYLPHHVSFLIGRAWYYINGEHIDVVGEAVKELSALGGETMSTVTKEAVETVVREL